MRTCYLEHLEPLAQRFGGHTHFGARVEAITRRGFDKVETPGRERAAFALRVRTAGREEDFVARG